MFWLHLIRDAIAESRKYVGQIVLVILGVGLVFGLVWWAAGLQHRVDALEATTAAAAPHRPAPPVKYDDDATLEDLLKEGHHVFSSPDVAAIAKQRVNAEVEERRRQTHRLIQDWKSGDPLLPYGMDKCSAIVASDKAGFDVGPVKGTVCDGFDHGMQPA